MKANELMIGDWIADKRGDKARVVNIITDEIEGCYYGIDTDANYTVQFEDARPIPLTGDILNKNFPDVRYGIAWYWDDNKSTYNETWYEVRTLDIEGMELCVNIRYVHELQHVLRLCGIEKEIVL